jgi:hypothetical protein
VECKSRPYMQKQILYVDWIVVSEKIQTHGKKLIIIVSTRRTLLKINNASCHNGILKFPFPFYFPISKYRNNLI